MSPSGGGGLRILESRAWPQPNPQELGFKLEGAADTLVLDLFTPNLVLTRRIQAPACAGGWCRLALPPDLGNGAWFYRLEARRGGLKSPPAKGVLYVAR